MSFIASTGAGNEAHFALIEKRHGGMRVAREVIDGFEPKDVERIFAPTTAAATSAGTTSGAISELSSVPGVRHSRLGLAHDRMHGGVKGRRMSKKDKLRAAAAREAASPSSRCCAPSGTTSWPWRSARKMAATQCPG